MQKLLVFFLCFYNIYCSLLLKDNTQTQFFNSEDNTYCDMQGKDLTHFNSQQVSVYPLKIDLLPHVRNDDAEFQTYKDKNNAKKYGNEFTDHIKFLRSINSDTSLLNVKLLYLLRTNPKLAAQLNYLNRNRREVKDALAEDIFDLYDSVRVNVHELSKRMGRNIDKINLEENVLERIKPCKKFFPSRIEPVHPADLITSKIFRIRNKIYNTHCYTARRFKRQEKNSDDGLLGKEFPEIDPRYDEDSKESFGPHIRRKRS